MPIYEYQCKKCEAVVEAIQKMADPPLTKHAGCGGKLDRIMSLTSFQLKGEGWYVTDYKKSGAKAEGAKTEGGEAKSEGKAEAKAEAKSEAKSETKSDSKSDAKPASAKPSKKKEKAA